MQAYLAFLQFLFNLGFSEDQWHHGCLEIMDIVVEQLGGD